MNPALPPPAFLQLAADGRIALANSSAANLWGEPAMAILGQPFTKFLALGDSSSDPDWEVTQWELLRDCYTDAWAPIDAINADGELLTIELRLEVLPDGSEDYFAWVRLPASSVAAAPATTPAAASNVLAECSDVAFFRLDVAAGQVDLSPAWGRQLGFAPGQLQADASNWLSRIHPEDSSAAPDRGVRAPLPGEPRQRPYRVEFRLQHRLGQWLWVENSGVQIFDAAGKLIAVEGVQLEITERKEAEEAGLLAEERLLLLTEDLSLPLFDFDPITGSLWVSPGWRALTGLPIAGDIPLASWAQTLPAEAEAEPLGYFTSLLRGAHTHQSNEVLQPLQAPPAKVNFAVHGIFNRRGTLQRVVGLALPLAGENTAVLLQQRINALLDASNEAIIITDERGCVRELNRNASRLTGFDPPETLPGPPLAEVFPLVDRDSGRDASASIELILSEDTRPGLFTEHGLASPTGDEPTSIVWTVRAYGAEPGNGSGLVVVFRDPEHLSLTPDELIKANRFDSLGKLAGGIAHDFNNLLTTILGSISQAKDNREYGDLADGEQACLTAKALTRQLLTFARGTQGENQRVLMVEELLRDALRIAGAGSAVKTTLNVATGAGPILGDRGQLLQVFQNLIINAVQAMPKGHRGEVLLNAQARPLTEGRVAGLAAGNYVQIDVRDNASGIPPEVLKNIWEPFFTTKQTGTGLGLATVLSIVRRHGGQIGVDTKVGTGTTFSVFLPITTKALPETSRTAASIRYGTGRILLMDDDPKICTLTGSMLQSLDYVHDVACNGDEALALYRKYLNVNRPYDAVLMDLTIVGGMGGEECLRQLLQLDPDVRAIVSSGYDDEDLMQRCLDQGFSGYLSKPYRVTDLGKILKDVLGTA